MSMPEKLAAMAYYGGKASKGGAGQWIARQLPWSWRSVYVEPFAGMLGVLLRRKPVHLEVVNDLDHKVVNWWRVVRDHPKELARLLYCTPNSRVEFGRALDKTDDEIEAARRFTVTILGAIHSGPNASAGNWRRSFAASKGGLQTPSALSDRIFPLCERMKNVQLEATDAVKLLVRLQDYKEAVIYCDPPYTTANVTPYAVSKFDKGSMVDVLRAQKGSVAISGYNDEWDDLGWRCESRQVMRSQIKGRREDRTEKLWMNYPAMFKGMF